MDAVVNTAKSYIDSKTDGLSSKIYDFQFFITSSVEIPKRNSISSTSDIEQSRRRDELNNQDIQKVK
jgi:hypothetical protein